MSATNTATTETTEAMETKKVAATEDRAADLLVTDTEMSTLRRCPN